MGELKIKPRSSYVFNRCWVISPNQKWGYYYYQSRSENLRIKFLWPAWRRSCERRKIDNYNYIIMLWLLIEASRYFDAYHYLLIWISIQMYIVLILNIIVLVFNALDHYCSTAKFKGSFYHKNRFCWNYGKKIIQNMLNYLYLTSKLCEA